MYDNIYANDSRAQANPSPRDGSHCPNCGYCPHCGRSNGWYPSFPPNWPPYGITWTSTGY